MVVGLSLDQNKRLPNNNLQAQTRYKEFACIVREVDTKSPRRQGFCAKISDDAPPERLPR